MYKVTEIISGNSISVSPNWNIAGESGNLVKINGYKLEISDKKTKFPEVFVKDLATNRLKILLSDKLVELRVRPTETGDALNDGVLSCRIYLNDVDISNYFVEFDK